MRQLWLMSGAPGCGKSTLINELGIGQYTLSPDELRLMCQTPMLQIDGSLGISQKNDKYVWDTLFYILEERMARGEFTVVDACHSKPKDFTRYKQLSDKYRYRMFALSLRDVPLETILQNNRKRPHYKVVPEDVIRNIHARFSLHKISSSFKTVLPNEFEQTVRYTSINFDKYNRVHHIGDIHGCYTALMELLGCLKDDELYIFIGDYLDRGIENAQVFKFIQSISERPNVILLEGNHEHHLKSWGWGEDIKSREFRERTLPDLVSSGVTDQDARKLVRHLNQICYYTYDNKTVFCCHGGVPLIPDNPSFVSSDQFIRGVGQYKDMIAVNNNFEQWAGPREIYMVHGHRNIEKVPTKMNSRVFNIDGDPDIGLTIRMVTLDRNGFTTTEVENKVFNQVQRYESIPVVNSSNVIDLIGILRSDKGVLEKSLGNNISSFNFKRQVFNNKDWNDRRVTARGLFINTTTGQIVARSYNKMFNMNERPETELANLQSNLKFPCTLYQKENGFLGLIGYNEEKDELFISTKSSDGGDYSHFFKNIISQDLNKVQKYVKDNGCTLVLEVIDVENDPHIIEYPSSRIYLLDIVKRDLNFELAPYEDVVKAADDLGFHCKTIYKTFDNWTDFATWSNGIDKIAEEIEGVVLCDSASFMMKIKFPYYNKWKHARSLVERFRKGRFGNQGETTHEAEITEFMNFLKTLDKETLALDIIKLRTLFHNGEKNGQD